jgi:hypothetical protein
MAHQVRNAFQAVFKSSPTKLGLAQVYDVSAFGRQPRLQVQQLWQLLQKDCTISSWHSTNAA